MAIARILLYASALLFILGCQSSRALQPVDPVLASPVIVFDPPVPLQEAISLDSPNAAMRLIALRADHPLELRSIGDVDIHLDAFRMIDWEEEAELDPVVHRRYLMQEQSLIASIMEASRLPHFDLYPGSLGYRGRIEQDGPRTGFLSWLGHVRKLLKDDAIRAWADGDRTASLERVETMIRLATQLPKTSHADSLDRIFAEALVASALTLLDAMVHHVATTDADRARMRSIVGLLDGPDPLGNYAATRRVIASYDQLVATGLAEPKGSPALWQVVGEMHAIGAASELIMKSIFEGSQQSSDGPESIPNGQANRAAQFQAMIDSIIADLDGLTVRDLRTSYRHARPLVQTALDELAKPEPELAVFEAIRETLSSDETGIPEILHLPFLRSLVQTAQRTLAQRDRLQAALTD